MSKSKLFQYAIIFHPTEEEVKKHNTKSKLIKELTTVLEKDEKTVAILASRAIPEEYLDKLDQVEVVIANF
jgi:hypothetical protein